MLGYLDRWLARSQEEPEWLKSNGIRSVLREWQKKRGAVNAVSGIVYYASRLFSPILVKIWRWAFSIITRTRHIRMEEILDTEFILWIVWTKTQSESSGILVDNVHENGKRPTCVGKWFHWPKMDSYGAIPKPSRTWESVFVHGLRREKSIHSVLKPFLKSANPMR